jgi:hypothetical protein
MVARRYTAEVCEVCVLADISSVPAGASQYRARQETRMQRLDMIPFLSFSYLLHSFLFFWKLLQYDFEHTPHWLADVDFRTDVLSNEKPGKGCILTQLPNQKENQNSILASVSSNYV